MAQRRNRACSLVRIYSRYLMLTPGTRLGSYEVVAPLGAGGMGEVYRARDARLGRDVALKVLPAHVAADPDLKQRFEREARTLAALSHPHICPVFDVGQEAGIDFLVMECLEGETLADRLTKGPLPRDQALRVATQVADALDKAHRKGIIHRDLKPGNIMLVRRGGPLGPPDAKLLDFGLATAAAAGQAGGNRGAGGAGVTGLSMLPTTPRNLTVQGTILGTFQYMAPEQLEGADADARTDIFAFGAVVYEMLTGRTAFEGKSQASLISSIMSSEPPPVSSLVSVAPPALDQIVRTCLAKDPDQRWQTAGDIERQLRWIADGRSQSASQIGARAPVVPRRWSRKVVVAAVAGCVAGAALAAAGTWWAIRPSPAAPQRLSVVLPVSHPLSLGGNPVLSIAIAPDGMRIAYVGQNPDAPPGPGRRQLFIRSLDTVVSMPIPGTEGAAQPFFSPDGQWLGFFTTLGELKKVSLAGGSPITVAEKLNGSAWTFGTWTNRESIVFGYSTTAGLREVSVDGGEPRALTTADAAQGELEHGAPEFIPEAEAVLFVVRLTNLRSPRLEAVILATGERRVVLENAIGARYLASGHLLFRRDDVIMVAPFDASRLAVTGPAVPVVDNIRRVTAVGELAVSRSGTLVYVPAAEDARQSLGIVTRNGAFQPLGPAPNLFSQPSVSPDGQHVAFEVPRPAQDTEVYLHDLARGATRKLTQQGADTSPTWRPTTRELSVTSTRADQRGIFLKDLIGGGERLLIPLQTGIFRNASWSPDGRLLAYTVQQGAQHDIWVLTMGDKPSAQPLMNSLLGEHSPRFSPDGRWLAYVAGEVGLAEVYVRRYPDGPALPVSAGPAEGPVWARNGREIFFTSAADGTPRLMAVSVAPEGDSLRLGAPTPLFDMRVAGPTGTMEQYVMGNNAGSGYDVFPDGQRFVMVRGADPQGTREIGVVQNFFEEVKRLAATR